MNRRRAAACSVLLTVLLSGCGSGAPPKPHPATSADRAKLDDAAQWVVSDAKVKAGECVSAWAQHGGNNPGTSCFRDPRANLPIGKMTMVDGVYDFDYVSGGGSTITAPDGGQVCVRVTASWDGTDSFVTDGACAVVSVTPPGTPLTPPAGARKLT